MLSLLWYLKLISIEWGKKKKKFKIHFFCSLLVTVDKVTDVLLLHRQILMRVRFELQFFWTTTKKKTLLLLYILIKIHDSVKELLTTISFKYIKFAWNVLEWEELFFFSTFGRRASFRFYLSFSDLRTCMHLTRVIYLAPKTHSNLNLAVFGQDRIKNYPL